MAETLKDFVVSLTKYNNVFEILNHYEAQTDKGYVFERLWDLVIKFGCCSLFPNSKYKHQQGKIEVEHEDKQNTERDVNGLTPLDNIRPYLENHQLRSGNASGASDISLFNNETKKYIFITCKYPKEESKNIKRKGVAYFGIQNIESAAKHANIKSYDIYILVHDKNVVLSIGSCSRTPHLSKYFTHDHILDVNDLNECFIILKNKLQSLDKYEDIETLYVKKPYLKTDFHQKLAIHKTRKLVSQGYKDILWACKCRAGKTYILGGFILVQSLHLQTYNVLIITPVLATIKQFTDDLFHHYADFKEFTVHHISSGHQFDTSKIDTTSKNIIILSKQLLDKKDVEILRQCKFDVVAFDENHFGGTTDYAQETLNNYCHPHTVRIYMTATYSKTIIKWNIPRECHIHWNIEDELWCKTGNFDMLIEKHGELEFYDVLYEITEAGEDIADVFTSYEKYPDMHMLTTLFDQGRYDAIKKSINDTSYGFSMETLFSLNEEQTEFLFPNDVQTFLGYISGCSKIQDFPHV
jgi:hypothetical protein